MTPARRLAAALAALMGVEASLGLAFEAQHRNLEWIRATCYGNDCLAFGVTN